MDVTLEQILQAREWRASAIKQLLAEYQTSVVSFKLNIPGSRKQSELYQKIFNNGVTLFKNLKFKTPYEKIVHLVTGSEAFFCILENASKVKQETMLLEEKHSLGRIFDFDVFTHDGKILKREDFGYERRKCILCENDAFVCSRSRAHDLEELLNNIEKVAINHFFNEKSHE